MRLGGGFLPRPYSNEMDTPPSAEQNPGPALAIVAAVVVLVLVLVAYAFNRSESESEEKFAPATDGLGGALAAAGWVLYTRPGCIYCEKQMDALGGAGYPKRVVCSGGAPKDAQAPRPCSEVAAFPFWVNERRPELTRTGLQSREELRRMAAG